MRDSELVTHTGEHVLLAGHVPVELKSEFVELARERDRSISAEMRRMLRGYLAETRSEDSRLIPA